MARTFSDPVKPRTAGMYGPFALDSLTNANTEKVVVKVKRAVESDWPDVDPLFTLFFVWDTGGSSAATVSGNLTKGGVPQMEARLEDTIPDDYVNGQKIKRNVSGGYVTITVHADCRAGFEAYAE